MVNKTASDDPVDKPNDIESVQVSERASTALYLEDLQRRIMAEYHTKDFKNSTLLHTHLDDDYYVVEGSKSEHSPTFAESRQEVLDNVERAIKNDKGFAWTINNVTVNVHRGKSSAEVCFVVHERHTMNCNKLWRENCGLSYFRRRLEDGVWVTHR